MRYDDQCYMGPGSAWRREFMSRWTQIAGGRAVIALSRQGDVVGCGCRRPAVAEADHQLVGPLYADTLDVARQLVHALTSDVAGHNVSINIWYKSYGPITIAIRARFEYDSSAIQHPTRSYVLSSNNEYVNSFALL